jgi:ketosteroid isomerase-like protein
MKYVALIAFCSLLSFGCTVQQQNKPITEKEVNELVDRWLTLWSSYDLNRLDSIFWNDPHMTYFSSEKRGLIKGYDQMKSHHEGFGFVTGGKQPAKTLWLEDIDITLQPDFAVVGGIWYFGDKSMPKDSVQNGPVSFVMLRDSKGVLKIAHTHFANY